LKCHIPFTDSCSLFSPAFISDSWGHQTKLLALSWSLLQRKVVKRWFSINVHIVGVAVERYYIYNPVWQEECASPEGAFIDTSVVDWDCKTGGWAVTYSLTRPSCSHHLSTNQVREAAAPERRIVSGIYCLGIVCSWVGGPSFRTKTCLT